MGRGWLLSSLLHMSLAAVLWLGLPSWGRPLPAIESGITVELVSEAELTPPEPAVAALAPEPEREAARPVPPPEPERVPEPDPPAPEPVVAPEPPPEPVVESAPEPPSPPEPEVARVEPEPPAPEPAIAPEPEPVRPEPEPEPEPEVALAPPAPEPEPEPPPEPEREPKPEPQQAALPPPQEAPEPPPPSPKPQVKPKPPAPQPEPERAKAEPKPAPPEPPQRDEFDDFLASVEEMDRRLQDEARQEGTGRRADASGQAPTTVGEASLSDRERAALNRALVGEISECWIPPVSGGEGGDERVPLRIQMRPDRTVATVEIEDQWRLDSDPTYRAVAESGRRAVEKCSPLRSVAGYPYAVWRDMLVRFTPPS